MALTFVNVPLEAVQTTPELLGSFATVAVNFRLWFTVTPPRFGEMLTPRLLGIEKILIVADAELLRSEVEAAVKVTFAGLGATLGAVNVIDCPDALEVVDNVPHAFPVHPAPASDQSTP